MGDDRRPPEAKAMKDENLEPLGERVIPWALAIPTVLFLGYLLVRGIGETAATIDWREVVGYFAFLAVAYVACEAYDRRRTRHRPH